MNSDLPIGYSRKLSEYKIWDGARGRCTRKNSKDYPRYGGRGIKFCKKWSKSFLEFYKDMGPRPSPFHTLDRIDNDGDYKPSNCRWATRYQQHNNKRQNLPITINGETKNLKQWCKIYNISHQTVGYRVKRGCSYEQALSLPVDKGNRLCH